MTGVMHRSPATGEIMAEAPSGSPEGFRKFLQKPWPA